MMDSCIGKRDRIPTALKRLIILKRKNHTSFTTFGYGEVVYKHNNTDYRILDKLFFRDSFLLFMLSSNVPGCIPSDFAALDNVSVVIITCPLKYRHHLGRSMPVSFSSVAKEVVSNSVDFIWHNQYSLIPTQYNTITFSDKFRNGGYT